MRCVPSSFVYWPRVANSKTVPSAYSKIELCVSGVSCEAAAVGGYFGAATLTGCSFLEMPQRAMSNWCGPWLPVSPLP